MLCTLSSSNDFNQFHAALAVFLLSTYLILFPFHVDLQAFLKPKMPWHTEMRNTARSVRVRNPWKKSMLFEFLSTLLFNSYSLTV